MTVAQTSFRGYAFAAHQIQYIFHHHPNRGMRHSCIFQVMLCFQMPHPQYKGILHRSAEAEDY